MRVVSGQCWRRRDGAALGITRLVQTDRSMEQQFLLFQLRLLLVGVGPAAAAAVAAATYVCRAPAPGVVESTAAAITTMTTTRSENNVERSIGTVDGHKHSAGGAHAPTASNEHRDRHERRSLPRGVRGLPPRQAGERWKEELLLLCTSVGGVVKLISCVVFSKPYIQRLCVGN